MINERFGIAPKNNSFWKEAKLLGKFIWDNKGKCTFALLATIIIPLGSATAIPIIQKFRKLRKEKSLESREILKKMEPV
jgi:hypothetical protein